MKTAVDIVWLDSFIFWGIFHTQSFDVTGIDSSSIPGTVEFGVYYSSPLLVTATSACSTAEICVQLADFL